MIVGPQRRDHLALHGTWVDAGRLGEKKTKEAFHEPRGRANSVAKMETMTRSTAASDAPDRARDATPARARR